MLTQLLIYATAYVLGAIPVGRIIGKFFSGEDIWEYGDGTAGFANLFKLLGLEAALLKISLEVCKGVLLGFLVASNSLTGGSQLLTMLLLVTGFVYPMGQVGKEGFLSVPLYSYIWYLYPSIGGMSLALLCSLLLLKFQFRNALKVSALFLLIAGVLQGQNWLCGLIFFTTGFFSYAFFNGFTTLPGTFTRVDNHA